MNPIKIDLVFPTGGSRGGVENVTRLWTEHLDKEKFQLRILFLGITENFLGDFGNAFVIPTPKEEITEDYLCEAYKHFIVHSYEPDICIALLWTEMVRAAVKAKHDLHLNMKVVSWMHNNLSFYEQMGADPQVEVLTSAHYHLVIDQETVNRIKAKDPDAACYLIGNPVEEVNIDTDKQDPLALVYVGRLEIVKRLDLILEAIYRSKYPWKLKIIGDGDIRENVEEWIDMMSLRDRVTMLGWQTDPFACCRECGIMVMASDYEGFPLVAVEALTRGKTLLSTPVNGITDYLKPGVNGYLWPHDNAVYMAQVLDGIAEGRIARCNPEACHKSVAQYFLPEYFRRVEEVLEEIYKC